MAFSRPTLKEIRDRVIGDLEAHLEGADAHLRRSNVRVLAAVLAGVAHGLYGFLGWVARQVLPDTADDSYLERWASLWGLYPRTGNEAAGPVQASGLAGSVVEAGTFLQREDGVLYSVDEEVTFETSSATLRVTGLDPGEAGNAESGTRVTFVSPVPGVESGAVVAEGGLIGGTDPESASQLLGRLEQHLQEPPQGGAAADYEGWALEVAGVTRVWVYPGHLGLGTVGVAFAMDDAETAPIPDEATVAAVQAHVDELRPVTAAVTVFAPDPVPLNPEISLTPDTADVRAAVQAELEDLLLREAEPGGTLLISHLRAAISQAAGETDHVLISPSANVEHGTGRMPVLGTISWA